MPYSFPDSIPRPARNWTEEEQKKCIAAANAVLKDGGKEQQAIFACIRAAGKTQHPGGEGKAAEEATDMEGEKATWNTAAVNDLPDSSFLYVEAGGGKDKEGKTKPRSLRHFPYKDAGGKVDIPHLRNALARIPQSSLPDDVKKRVIAKARRIAKSNGIEVGEKAIAWLDADHSRLGGYAVLWGDKATKDIEGEFFDQRTDFWLGRWPVMPWMYHHGVDDSLKAEDAVLGTVRITDMTPDDVGLWYEAQVDKSHRYYDMVRRLIDEGLLGTSSGALPRRDFVRVAKDGHIESWPMVELSGTVAPADPRQIGDLEFLRSAYKAIGIDADFEGGESMTNLEKFIEGLKGLLGLKDEKKTPEVETPETETPVSETPKKPEEKAAQEIVLDDSAIKALAENLVGFLPEIPDIEPVAASVEELARKVEDHTKAVDERLKVLEAADDVKVQKRIADTGSGVLRAIYIPRKDGEKATDEDKEDGKSFLREFVKGK